MMATACGSTTNTPLDSTPVEQLITIAADTIADLRKSDVFRILETYPSRRNALAYFIAENRPDLHQEASEVMMELYSETMARTVTTSWVIKDKAKGAVIMETFDPCKVDALNTAKYKAVGILQHLQDVARSDAN